MKWPLLSILAMATTRTSRIVSGRRSAPARRIRDVLRARILSDAYGDQPLPSEGQLAADFGTSRNIVREVLTALRLEGLVDRIPGSGTFVVSDKVVQGLDRLRGLAETVEAVETGCDRVVNQVLFAEQVPATPLIAERLGLAPGAAVVSLERIRTLDAEPLSLDTSYLPADIGIALLELDLVRHDVFGLIERQVGLPLGAATVRIEAIAADAVVADLLRVREGSPLLFFERLTYSRSGRPVDLEFVRYRGDRFSLAGLLERQPFADQPRRGRGAVVVEHHCQTA